MIDKELLKLIRGNVKYIVITVIINILGLLASLGITAAICWSLKIIADGNAVLSDFLYPIIIATAGIVIRFLSVIAAGKIKSRLGAGVKRDLRERLYGKIVRLNQNNVEGLPLAGLTQVSIEGIEQLDTYYTVYLPQFFYSMIAPFILFAVTAFIHLGTAFVLLACVPLIPISIIMVSKFAKKIFAKYWDKYTSMGGEFLDSLNGLKDLKIFDADERQNKRINESAEEFRKITMKVLVMQLLSMTIMDLVAFGGAGAGIAVAVLSGANNGLLPFYCLFIVFTAVEFFLPLRAFGSAFHVGMNGATAGRKILKLLDAKEEKWGTKICQDKGGLSLRDVSFCYESTRGNIGNVSMDFPHGKVIAIAGESGSGKSTVTGLLSGALHPEKGKVLAGNESICEFSRESFYSRLCVVNSKTYIFDDTIRNNFLLAKSGAAESEIWDALKSVKLDGFIREAGGLDKSILEDADNISGGQKQRLALAISLIKEKDFYIFDEVTSNIDIESETIIMQHIYRIKKRAAVVLISHRLENIVDADGIYFLSKGEVIEKGTHAELIKQNGKYAEMYFVQKRLEDGFKEVGAYA